MHPVSPHTKEEKKEGRCVSHLQVQLSLWLLHGGVDEGEEGLLVLVPLQKQLHLAAQQVGQVRLLQAQRTQNNTDTHLSQLPE